MTIIKCTSLTDYTSCIFQQQVNNGRLSGCYNTYCPGFVVTSFDYPLNAYFDKVSEVNGQQFVHRLSIIQVKFTNFS